MVLAGVALLVVPWMARNQAQAGTFTISTNLGVTLSGAYCDEVFRPGARYGGWSNDCALTGVLDPSLDARPPGPDRDLAVDRSGRDTARRFAEDHAGDLPGVAVARVQRLWSLGHNADQMRWDVFETGHAQLQRVGRYLHWLLLPFALVGVVVLPRERWRSWVLVALPAVTTTLSATVVYGSPRLRAVVEPTIALFAAAGMVWMWSRLARRPSLAAEMGALGEAATTETAPAGGEPAAEAGNRGQ